MPDLILHIGAPKTGTTFLQNSLAESRNVLDAAGVAYHQIPGSLCACHWWFAIPFFEQLDQYESARIDLANGVSAKALSDRGNAALQYFSEEIARAHVVVLSAEQFLFLPEPVLQRLAAHLRSQGVQVKVVIYIRNAFDAVLSEINQKVKMGQARLASLGWVATPLNLPQYLEAYARAFGRESIDIRPYVLPRSEVDIVTDFVNAYLPTVDAGTVRRTTVRNPSLSAEALYVIDRCNAYFLSDPPHSTRRDSVVDALSNFGRRGLLLAEAQERRVAQDWKTHCEYLHSMWGFDADRLPRSTSGGERIPDSECALLDNLPEVIERLVSKDTDR